MEENNKVLFIKEYHLQQEKSLIFQDSEPESGTLTITIGTAFNKTSQSDLLKVLREVEKICHEISLEK